MRAIAYALLFMSLMIGCSRQSSTEPSASPSLTDKATCDSIGGKWDATMQRCFR